MLWKAWLNVEVALVIDYMVYLMRFAEFEERMKRWRDSLDAARKAWVNDQLEEKFERSKAFQRHQISPDS